MGQFLNFRIHHLTDVVPISSEGENGIELAPSEIDQLTSLSLESGGDMHPLVAEWQERGIDLADIYLKGIAEAAKVLGRLWETDRLDFASVTVGGSNLLRLLYDLSPQFLAKSAPSLQATAMLLSEPGTQHTMGMFILSEFFRKAGWYTLVEQPSPDIDFLRLLSTHWVDVLAFSISTDRELHSLMGLVKQARLISPNPQMVVIAGGPLASLEPHLLANIGFDWLSSSVSETIERANLTFKSSTVALGDAGAVSLRAVG